MGFIHLDHAGEKGVANGLATLDGSALVPSGQLPAMVGDSGSGGIKGAVPAPAAGDATKFLAGNASWTAINGIQRAYVLDLVATGVNVALDTDAIRFTVPVDLDGSVLSEVEMQVDVAGTTGTLDVQVRNMTTSLDMLSTKLTIDSGETHSKTAAIPAVIDVLNEGVSEGDNLRISIDAIPTTPPQGLRVVLTFSASSLTGVFVTKPSGLLFSRTSVTTLTLTPSGIDSTARIPCTSGAVSDLSVESVTNSLTMDITVSGAGGLHSNYTEAANKGYDIYFLTGSAGQALIAVEFGQLPIINWALPSGYSRYSRPIFWIRNDASSNIVDFVHSVDSYCYFVPSIPLVYDAKPTTWTQLILDDVLPNFAGCVNAVMFNLVSYSSSVQDVFYAAYLTTAIFLIGSVGQPGVVKDVIHHTELMADIPVYYKWLSLPTHGSYISVEGFRPY